MVHRQVIRRNRLLLELAHLDRDDVYQDLALRLIRAITGYDPSKGLLKTHILSQLQYELLNCKSSRRRYGFKNAPYDLRGAVVSMESLMEYDPYWESRIAA